MKTYDKLNRDDIKVLYTLATYEPLKGKLAIILSEMIRNEMDEVEVVGDDIDEHQFEDRF